MWKKGSTQKAEIINILMNGPLNKILFLGKKKSGGDKKVMWRRKKTSTVAPLFYWCKIENVNFYVPCF